MAKGLLKKALGLLMLLSLAGGAGLADTNQPRDAQGRFVKKGAQNEKFTCKGIGKGQHKKGMTEDECVKLGGTVVH
jgi:hypothetical protein